MSTFKYFDLMERYLRGPMGSEDRFKFETTLKENKELAAEWSDYMLIARSVSQSLRNTAHKETDIKQLVEDARALAKERGLLLTLEDIWLFIRGQAEPDQAHAITERYKNDESFARMFDREKIIIEAIKSFSKSQSILDRVRDSMIEDNFIQSINDQIQAEIEKEEPGIKNTLKNGPFDFIP